MQFMRDAYVFLLIGAGTLAIAAVATYWLSRHDAWLLVLDHPNERSLHTHATPRTGGIAILLACILGGAFFGLYIPGDTGKFAWLGTATLLLAATSFIDDRRGLAAVHRLLIHLIVAAMLFYGGFVLQTVSLPGLMPTLPIAVAVPITVLYIAWMVNLYNFMDGMDGFAGGMTLFGFGTYAILGALAGNPLFAALNLVVAAAAMGFLCFNFPPARIFMGDTGSSSLGLFAAAFSIWASQERIFPLWIALLVFSPFIVDATVTLFRRAFAGERIWQPHKTHYYQRLVLLGWNHRRTVLWQYALMTGCAVSAVLAWRAPLAAQWTVIGFWVVAYTAMASAVRHLETKAENFVERKER
jgi:UDP-N-acetylmuramyl pentapeptide phosphotransferase/UDP-N-acetylglucosamine-1-phosphate transferase